MYTTVIGVQVLCLTKFITMVGTNMQCGYGTEHKCTVVGDTRSMYMVCVNGGEGRGGTWGGGPKTDTRAKLVRE